MQIYAGAQGGDESGLWRELRARFGAVAPVEVAPGVPGWLLLGYHENLRVLRDQDRFAADPLAWSRRSGHPGAAGPRNGALAGDGPEHRRLRSVIVDSLAQISTAQVVPVVERTARGLIGAALPTGGMDLIGQYAAPLPALVLNRLLGLPDAYGRLLAGLAADIWSGDPARAEPATRGLHTYAAGLVERKRENPGDDLASRLLAHPAGLSDDEAVEQLLLLWAAGHEPTTHLVGNALYRLLSVPEIAAAYGGASLPADDFLDYVMWVDPPLRMLTGRYSVRDVELGGAHIRKGEALVLGFGPAHADPVVTARADTGDALALAGNRAHLMWGAGAHGCPAQSLAREIAGTAIDTLLNRLPRMAPAAAPAELRWRSSLSVHGLAELPVVFPAEGERGPGPAPERPERERGRPRRMFGRGGGRPRAQGARYQAPAAAPEEPPAPPVRPERPARPAKPRPAGARYQAPAAAPEEPPAPPVRPERPARPAKPRPAGARYQAPAAPAAPSLDALDALLEKRGDDGPG
ncbi:cytochrome P450 [Nocardiopsis sediminis]|uniref:Cytochrome P450 n=1 Tax=Nocardiopsis sediminis TaxID=1778267 RepID=A0ABV8FKH5_9ACTN